MKWSNRCLWVRFSLILLGALALVLSVAYPTNVENVVNWNDDGMKTDAVSAGDIIMQHFITEQAFDQIGIRIEAVREAKNLVLDITLEESGGKNVCSQTFSLKRVKAKGKLILEFPPVSGGEYLLTIVVSGEGTTKFGGGDNYSLISNGQVWPTGCALRIRCVKKTYSRSLLFSSVLLVMLACVPGGGRRKLA
ncbi:MAG: hypothetical protein IKK21_02235 [Clostridia bacterium]|nr:hypothetical protein [Clostridia bacterium]